MVGMHTTGFDRLVRALDEYAEKHPETEVVIQAGSGAFRPRHARSFDFKGHLQDELEAADLVVSQGSIGFFDALRLGKRLIVVPRLCRFGEAIDDHQLRFAEGCARKYGFPVIVEIAELGAAIAKVSREPPSAPSLSGAGAGTGLYRELGGYLAGLAAGMDPAA